jgi:patatin-related protein
MSLTTDVMESKRVAMQYESEIRFGVVMYGGVSLAMYINGVANEMYEMVCATPKYKTEGKLTGTRELYRRLSWLLGNPSLRKEYSSRIRMRTTQPDGEVPGDVWTDELLKGKQPPTRLVVDVIAGTSAGGINGIFLAKALANGEQFACLKDLWVTEGDIGLLLNDNRSYEGLDKCEQRSPNSLLNGDRMYLKLHQVMEGMGGKSPASNSLIDEMDLFVTTTDVKGSPVPLRLSDDVVYERRYKRSFHFKYSNEANRCNDFASNDENNALLAFAARCTSSFPFAFEPMTLEAAAKLLKPGCFDKVEKTSFFSQFPKAELKNGNHFSRAFGDGGYLDNKPFTYVAKTLSIRQALVPVERILLYVEPAPQLVEAHESPSNGDGVPDALTNSLDALTSIPRYETIREDLQAILKRNRRIERIDRIVREGEIDLHRMLEGESNPFVHILRDKGGAIPPFPDFNRKDMVTYFGTAFLSYRRMRVFSVTDKIAGRLAELWGTDRASDHRYALTALVREWRDRHYQEEPQESGQHESINQFFSTFDVGYRIRRLSFLLRQVDHLTRVIRKICTETTGNPAFELTDEKFDLLPDSDRWSIDRLEDGQGQGDGGLPLRNGKQDVANMERALAALSELKREFNEIQGEWRRAEQGRGAVSLGSALEEGMLREELNTVLSLLLGDKDINPTRLTTRSGFKTTVRLPEQAVEALSSARTMQESVMIRARALHETAKGSERTMLQDTLEAGIRSMSLSKDMPNLWEKLGKPRLRLAGNNTTLELDFEMVKSDILNSTEGKLISRVLGEYYVYFDLFDQMSFPLYNGSDIGEPCTVEVVRISPKDAKTLVDEKPGGRSKLAGTSLSNFGGFLDKRWRINDIMWGRLDGAERLIKALLPMSDTSTVAIRKELTELAHRAILRETFVPDGVGKLVDLLQKDAERSSSSKSTVGQTHGLGVQAGSGQLLPHGEIKEMLSMLLSDQKLIDYVKQHDVDRTLDPKTTLENASRAVTITGRVLEQIRTREGKRSSLFRWLVRSGLLFQGLVAVALPGSLKSLLISYFLPVLYLFEGLWLAFALLIGSAGARSFAVTALVVTSALHVLILVLRDRMESKAGMSKVWPILASLILLLLATVGVVALANFDWRELLLGESVR